MAIALRGYYKTNNSHAAVTTLATTYTGWQTSNPAVGDMLVTVILATASGETFTQTAGTGTWTIVSSDSNTATNAPFSSMTGYRIYTAGDTAPTFGWGTAAAFAYTIMAFYETTGLSVTADATAAVQIDTTAATAHTPNTASASTTTDLSLVLNAARYQTTGASAITMVTPCSGYTAISIGGYAGATGFYADSTSGYYKVPVGAGTVTPGAETFNETVANNAYQILFQVATGGTTAAQLAPGTGTAQPPSPAVTVTAVLAAGTGAALAANAGGGNVFAMLATGTGTVLNPAIITGTVTRPQAALPGIMLPGAGLPANVSTVTGGGTSSGGTALLASSFATPPGPVPAVTVPAGLAAGTGGAPGPFAPPQQAAFAQLAAGTGTALQPVISAITPGQVATARRIHGRSGVVYLSPTAGAAASPVAFLSDWDISYAGTPIDTTVLTDTQHRYTAGQPTETGTFTGFYDTSTAQTYAAAVDGQPRNFYLYPATMNAGQFFSGLILPDYNLAGGVTSAVKLSVTWSAAGPITKTG